MSEARVGDTIRACYTGRLGNGQVFDKSHDDDPIEFTIGERRVVRGLEDAVTGMQPGESKTTVVPANKAYGPVRPDRILTVKREDIPNNVELAVGKRLQVPTTSGRKIGITVKDLSDTEVTFDANHPLAGKDLTFEVRLLEIAENAGRRDKIPS